MLFDPGHVTETVGEAAAAVVVLTLVLDIAAAVVDIAADDDTAADDDAIADDELEGATVLLEATEAETDELLALLVELPVENSEYELKKLIRSGVASNDCP